ncbi:thioredoxin [Sulfolobus acidocaldarius SUSAZ]|nr:thioredoxin [Sulfolobus acidocaldarius SUSAZ]
MNRLGNVSSAFLKLSSGSPIDWFPWSDEAFDKAKKEDKPVLVDVGASWCHWCHVMDETTYEDKEVIDLINKNFVAIKVDRDEMPDLDRRLQLAVSSITGESGWPLTVFMTPDGKVFFGGTYFPPEDSYGRVGFKRLLNEIVRLWKNERDKIFQTANSLHSSLQNLGYQKVEAHWDQVESIVSYIASNFDFENGGLLGSMKFPHPTIDQLLIAYSFYTKSDTEAKLSMFTLKKMYYGGIFDQVGGGFHRYTVDSEWYVPHFEKLLIDNAELLISYMQAYMQSEDIEILDAMNMTVNFILRELSTVDGFSNSVDADSEGAEGYYYTWTLKEFQEALNGEDINFWIRFFNVDTVKEVEGRKVLRRNYDLRELSKRFKDPIGKLNDVRERLRVYREERRKYPFIDTNVYTHSNCRTAEALTLAYPITGKGLKEALKVVDMINTKVTRRLTGGKDGLPEDYASALLSLLSAYEVTGKMKYRDLALKIGRELKEMDYNYPIDSPNESNASLANKGLLKLSLLDESFKFTPNSYSIDSPYIAGVTFNSMAFEKGLAHIVIVDEKDGKAKDLHLSSLKIYHPFKVVELVSEDSIDMLPSFIKSMVNYNKGSSRAYVCIGNTCNLPVDSSEKIRLLLGGKT